MAVRKTRRSVRHNFQMTPQCYRRRSAHGQTQGVDDSAAIKALRNRPIVGNPCMQSILGRHAADLLMTSYW